MITAARLRELFTYSKESGLFTRLVASSHAKVGDMPSCTDGNGYVIFHVDGELHRAHRLAWLYVTGEWPETRIDHKDQDRKNNRWLNLRLATSKQNAENSRDRADNTSGYRGVVKRKDCARWLAQIRHNGKSIYLGLFKTPEEASAIYEAKRAELFTHHKEVV